MSISDLYSSGQHKQDLGHFASLVKLAQDDDVITEGEQNLLDKTAKRLNIAEDKYEAILKEPSKFPVNPPVSYDERIERLYYLAKMVIADGKADVNEVKLMRKVAVGLHFEDNTEEICNKAIDLTVNNNDLDEFTLAIKKVGKI